MRKGVFRVYKDSVAKIVIGAMTTFPVVILILITLGLYLRSRPILAQKALSDIFFSTKWFPSRGEFGLLSFIAGTFWVTAVAAAIAVPLSILSAIHLSEYAHKRIRAIARPVIDLLSGIPSVVFGVWGILVIVPLIRNHIAPWFGVKTTGYTVLAGGVVLAIMVFPVIISVCAEVFQTVPQGLREASLSLGATKWQTVKHVVLRKAMPGIIAAVILGVSRVLGETMAVLMVVGNVQKIPHSLLDPAYPLPALIANNYGEMMSVKLYDSALLLSALVLLAFVVFFNVIARIVLLRIERRTA
jgi:phosphate transport system permease protein